MEKVKSTPAKSKSGPSFFSVESPGSYGDDENTASLSSPSSLPIPLFFVLVFFFFFFFFFFSQGLCCGSPSHSYRCLPWISRHSLRSASRIDRNSRYRYYITLLQSPFLLIVLVDLMHQMCAD
jgi:hypothetical protein